MINVGIIGGAGYTAGELIRLLVHHPQVNLSFINSTSNAGKKVTDVHSGLYGDCDITFTNELPFETIDVLYLCTAHGDSVKFLEQHTLPSSLKIIDFSMDYRFKRADHDFVYGLPELNKEEIKKAQKVANPGCFATCIQLALLPLAQKQLLNKDVLVNALTGSTGAGVKPRATTHFSWRDNNLSIYNAFTHRHVPEVIQSIEQLQGNFNSDIDFIPYRGDFPRGIFATLVTKTDLELEEIQKIYEDYYADAPFTLIINKELHLKEVVNTNKCLIHIQKHNNKLLIVSCIDNLLKGASGQAVQNMNLMFGLDESMGLNLKANAF